MNAELVRTASAIRVFDAGIGAVPVNLPRTDVLSGINRVVGTLSVFRQGTPALVLVPWWYSCYLSPELGSALVPQTVFPPRVLARLFLIWVPFEQSAPA